MGLIWGLGTESALAHLPPHQRRGVDPVASACNPPYEVSYDAESFQYDDNDDTDYQTESAVEGDLTLGVRSADHFKGSNVNSIAIRSRPHSSITMAWTPYLPGLRA